MNMFRGALTRGLLPAVGFATISFCQAQVATADATFLGVPLSTSGVQVINGAVTADDAWNGFQTLMQYRPAVRRAATGTDDLSQSDQLIQASAAARTFSTRFPNDKRAGQARKLEVLLALDAVQFGATAYQPTALAAAAAYRADKRNADVDRFDVALTVESNALAGRPGSQRPIDDGAAYAALADGLYDEFGDLPEVYDLYSSIIRTTDMMTSARVGQKILALKKAPNSARTHAQTAVDRQKLLGHALPLKLKTMGGEIIDLSRGNPLPTVVCFCSAFGAADEFAAVERFKAKSTTPARWLFVVLGAQPPVSDQPMAGSPLASSYCFEAAPFGGPLASGCKVDQTPYALVLAPGGAVTGYGFAESIPALLRAGGR